MTTFRTTTRIGPFYVGEVPEPLEITFEDADGNALDLTGYTVDFAMEIIDGDASTGIGNGDSALVTAASGVTTYTWSSDDLVVEGMYRGQMWAVNGSQRLASEMYEWFVTRGTSPNL